MLLVRLIILAVFSLTAQDILGQQWKAVRIPQDSIQPLALKFADSLHGYFYGVVPGHGLYSWYRTSDGGNNWVQIEFDSLFAGKGPRNVIDRNNSIISAFGKTVIIHPNSQMTNLNDVLLVSTDRGITWKKQTPEPKEVIYRMEFKAAYADDYHIGINGAAYSASMPIVTFDKGKTFKYIEGDETYRNATADTTGQPYRAGIDLACSNPNKWTVIVSPGGDNETTLEKPGLMTLTTNSGGDAWSFHQYYLPDDSTLWLRGQHGIAPRFIKGTSYLYFPTHQLYLSNRNGGGVKVSSQKTSYLYSSDYGATWQPETTFFKRRVAFEAVAPGEVWMTLWRYEDLRAGTYADVIVHTTDFGKTWEIDSSTLHPHEFTPLDGNIIYFTDPRHGWIAASNELGTLIYRYIAPSLGIPSDLPKYGYYYTLHPNPANQTITAHLAPLRRLERIEIYDVLGRKYLCPFKMTENNSAIVDCSLLNPGYYFIRMVGRQGTLEKILTSPFAIQR